jgi:integrase
MSEGFTKNAQRPGVRVRLHDLRRSLGSRYALTVLTQELQRLLRHGDIKTTLAKYANDDEALTEATLTTSPIWSNS